MYTIMLPCGSQFCECKVVECTKHFSMQCLISHTDIQLLRIPKRFARTVANGRTNQVGRGCIYIFIRHTTLISFFLYEGCKSDSWHISYCPGEMHWYTHVTSIQNSKPGATILECFDSTFSSLSFISPFDFLTQKQKLLVSYLYSLNIYLFFFNNLMLTGIILLQLQL